MENIMERLNTMEQKIDMLIECLGGADYLRDGHRICNDIFAIQGSVDHLCDVVRFKDPRLVERYYEDLKRKNDALEKLGQHTKEDATSRK